MPRRRCVLCNKHESRSYFNNCYPGRVRIDVAAAYRLGGLEACFDLLDSQHTRNNCTTTSSYDTWRRIKRHLKKNEGAL